jgi:SAM-dependent methyltransferase
MSKQEWKENTVPKILTKAGLWNFKEGEIVSILDVACGLSFKSKFIDAKIRVGVDIHEPYFEHIEADVPFAVVKYDVRKLSDIFIPNSFDLVIALDIIEHLEKDEAISMIKQCEKIARKAVVLETPEGYVPQNMDILGHGGDEWQTHRCGWEVKELEDLGYSVAVRDYKMIDVQRHTEIDVNTDIRIIDAIKYINN